MESLIKQTRLRFSGSKEERSNTVDRKIPPQKTQSFTEKKRSQSWIKRQFSREMSWDNDFSGSDYPTAVAAAAYAIHSLEESKSLRRKETTHTPDKSFSKTKSEVDDTKEKIEPLKITLKSSDESSERRSKRVPEKQPSLKKRISFGDEEKEKPQEKVTSSLKRPPTFADKQLSMGDSRRPDSPGGSAADAWEKEQMASIKERYEKLRATIDNWEAKKMKKAKRKLERIEVGSEKKRVKGMQKYQSEKTRIEGIAGGARAQAEENRRNEEFKVKDKANKIRATGKLPPTCLCF